jgi:hypothetical protein
VLTPTGKALRAFRGGQGIDGLPGLDESLNPVISVRAELEDVFTTHRPGMSKAQCRSRAGDLLGYYTCSVIVAWDFRTGTLTRRSTFDSDQAGKQYAHPGNHPLSVADVDADGRDEILRRDGD